MRLDHGSRFGHGSEFEGRTLRRILVELGSVALETEKGHNVLEARSQDHWTGQGKPLVCVDSAAAIDWKPTTTLDLARQHTGRAVLAHLMLAVALDENSCLSVLGRRHTRPYTTLCPLSLSL